MTTTRTDSSVRLLDRPSKSAVESLRQMLAYCLESFPTYARSFDAAGVDMAAISADDPMDMLAQLPVIGSNEVGSLSREAVSAVSGVVDTEVSSGSTGGRKVRLISYEDDKSEHEFLAELLAIAGVDRSDRVACVDTDPAAVMVSFPRACEVLGTRESYCVSTGAGFDRCLALLERLLPTVLISVPSIIQRILEGSAEVGVDSIRTVVHIGEGMSDATRKRIEGAFGAEVFSYYGSSETSGLGIECRAHAGVHLPGSRHIFEIDSTDHSHGTGALLVTTLLQRGLPLLRYRLGDIVRVRRGSCGCGVAGPRVDVLGRSEMFASILGSKIHYLAILQALQAAGLDGPLQVVLEIEGGSEVLTLRMTEANAQLEDRMRRAILLDHSDVEFLVDSGLLALRFDFRSGRELLIDRKSNRLIDLRDFDRS